MANKTIDERVAELVGNPWLTGNAEMTTQRRTELIRDAMLEVARDQRLACAEAVLAVEGDSNNPWMIDKDAAYSAILNAKIK